MGQEVAHQEAGKLCLFRLFPQGLIHCLDESSSFCTLDFAQLSKLHARFSYLSFFVLVFALLVLLVVVFGVPQGRRKERGETGSEVANAVME